MDLLRNFNNGTETFTCMYTNRAFFYLGEEDLAGGGGDGSEYVSAGGGVA